MGYKDKPQTDLGSKVVTKIFFQRNKAPSAVSNSMNTDGKGPRKQHIMVKYYPNNSSPPHHY